MLLPLLGQSLLASGGVDSQVASAQAQTVSATLANALSSTSSSSQAQSVTCSTGLALSGGETSSQAQGSQTATGLALDSICSVFQGQTVSAVLSSAGASVDCTVTSGQAQGDTLNSILMPMPTPGFPLRNWARPKQEDEVNVRGGV